MSKRILFAHAAWIIACLSVPIAAQVPGFPEPPRALAPAAPSDRFRSPVHQTTFRDLSEIDLNINISGEQTPPNYATELFSATVSDQQESLRRSHWQQTSAQWQAPEMFYHPLYFDDVALERYGQTSSVPAIEPLTSGLRFFGSVGAMPYKLVVDHPLSRVSPLGFYRPGSMAPQIRGRLRHGMDRRWHQDLPEWLLD